MDKLQYEKELLGKGYKYICGVDEVGRGPLAGPVVCAAVIMPLDRLIEGVDDSKKVSAKKREKLSEEILKNAIACHICRVEPQIIDEINILQATRLCMKNAVEGLNIAPDFVLTDGNMTLDIAVSQRSVIKGDALSYSIGAASIVAKVYRDNLMKNLAETYPQYGFESNVGYGSAKHIEAIKKFGLTPVHRRSFTTKWQ
ncbi:MAG: ribonuclease HII [Clostridiales bacterium]|nr:ribonuclease HII [Clostridiales bacterium]